MNQVRAEPAPSCSIPSRLCAGCSIDSRKQNSQLFALGKLESKEKKNKEM